MTKEYQITLVTPLFGGGVEAGMTDETLPIRGTAIRGQLQFWWRATRGAGFATHQKLFSRHAEIWGTTDRASPVEIDVRDVTASPMHPCARYDWNQNARSGKGGWRLAWEEPFASSPLPYVLFPFQGKQPASRYGDPEEPPVKFVDKASFTLKFCFPQALAEDVEAAVRAWVNFGGLGARTRRGCGALVCNEFTPRDLNDLGRWFGAYFANNDGNVREWPTVPSSIFIGAQPEAPIDAWRRVIGLLQAFRQGEGIGRNPGKQHNRPGRSRYPEPETIRLVTARRSSQHAKLAHIPDDAFPRAEFGLPIVFHFQGQGDPPDTVLYPSNALDGETRERMASPLILKPLVLTNGKAVPLILRLITPLLSGVELRQGNNSVGLPETSVVAASRLAMYRDSPLARSPTGSAIEAFIFHASNNGFHEITR